MSFLVIPAIDLKGGRCVRLQQGVASAETVYSDDPVAMARYWQDQGAQCLHVVDLDGAFQGQPVHADTVRAVVRALSIPVEIGGGLRTDAHLDAMVQAGVARVILGTRACENEEALQRLAERFGERLAVGIDARQGKVQVKGWTETTGTEAVDLARRMCRLGVRTLIYTDTATDGMLKGPNIPGVSALCEAVTCQVVASGGVASAAHMAALTALRKPNLIGAIVGKALYDKTVTLAELQQAVARSGC